MVKSPELSDVSDRTKCSADQEEQGRRRRSRTDKAKRSVWDVGEEELGMESVRGGVEKKKRRRQKRRSVTSPPVVRGRPHQLENNC